MLTICCLGYCDDSLFRILRRFAVGADATRDAQWIA